MSKFPDTDSAKRFGSASPTMETSTAHIPNTYVPVHVPVPVVVQDASGLVLITNKKKPKLGEWKIIN
jgi:hypothetical protein